MNEKRGSEQRSKNNRQQEERKVAFLTQLLLDTPYMECYSQWNYKCQPRPQGLFVFQRGGGRREGGLPQPRTQASSPYPSYKRRLGTDSEFSLQA